MCSLKPKVQLNLWEDTLCVPAAEARMPASSHIKHASLMLLNCPKILLNLKKNKTKQKWGFKILYRCNTFQELINFCYLLKERAKSHVFVLLMFLIETSDFVVVDEKMVRKGHPSTFQHGWQYGFLFVSSFTCYLLKLGIHSAWSFTSPACLCGKHPFLEIIFWLCLLTPFCVCLRWALKQICFLWGIFLQIPDWRLLKKTPNPTPHRFYMRKK